MKEKITIEKAKDFFNFLQGKEIEKFKISEPLNVHQAWNIVYFLQEYLRILPDHYEKCCACNELFDSSEGGCYCETEGEHYCENCIKECKYFRCNWCGEEFSIEKAIYVRDRNFTFPCHKKCIKKHKLEKINE